MYLTPTGKQIGNPMTRYFATTIDGIGEFVTSTPRRTFTHAVVVHRANTWLLDGFRSSEALATAGKRSVKVRWDLKNEKHWPVYILPAREITLAEYRAHSQAVTAAGRDDSRLLTT